MISQLRNGLAASRPIREVQRQIDGQMHDTLRIPLVLLCSGLPPRLCEKFRQMRSILLPVQGCMIENFDLHRSGLWEVIDYVLQRVRISEIVFCGQSHCHATAPCHDSPMGTFIDLKDDKAGAYAHLVTGVQRNQAQLAAAKQHVINQIETLKRHPTIAEKLASQTVAVRGLLYRRDSGYLQRLCSTTGEFLNLCEI